MRNKVASIIQKILCLTAIMCALSGIALTANAKMLSLSNQTELIQEDQTEEEIFDVNDEAETDEIIVTEDSDLDNPSGELMEEENIITANVGKYTGANILEVHNYNCNVTGTVINYIKKSYVNTSTGTTMEVLATEPKCLLFRTLYTEIGPYAFAGVNNPRGSSVVEERINRHLREIAFEAGSEMKIIDNYAFSNNNALKAFDGENAVNLYKLGDCVFYNDRYLELIVLPGNITSLGENVFDTNNESTKIVVPEGSNTDKILQGSRVLSLPQMTYYTYKGAVASDYSKKTFDLEIGGSGFNSHIYVDGKEIITTTDINCGASVKISIEPAEGYKLTAVPVSNITKENSEYTCTAKSNGYDLEFVMTQNTKIVIKSEIIKNNLEISVTKNFMNGDLSVTNGTNVSVVSANPWNRNYNYGTSLTISFSPTQHYHLGEVFLDNISQGIKSSINITMKENHTVSVSFLPDVYNLTLDYDSNKGTITGNKNSYEYGTKAALSIEPKEGYEIKQILVNGNAIEIANKIEISLSKDTKVQVDFQKIKYSISCSGEHAAFTNNTFDVFEYGADVNFNFQAEEGYRITDVLIDGISVGSCSSYQFSSLNNHHAIEVKTERITYEISIAADEGVIISNDCENVFYYHSTPEFVFQAEAGYRIQDICIDGVSIGTVSSYIFPELTMSHSIKVTAEKVYTVSLEYDSERGQAAVNKAEYAEGEEVRISLYPKEGYYVSSLRIDNLENMVEPAGQSYTLENIGQNHIVYVIFTTTKVSEVEDKDTILDGILNGEGTGRETTDAEDENNSNNGGDKKEDENNGEDSGNEAGGNHGGVSGNEAGGNNGGVSGNEAGGNNGGVSGNEAGGNNGGVSGNEAGGNNGGVSGNEAGGNHGGVSGNEAGGNDGSVSGNEAVDNEENGSSNGNVSHYLPDKTQLSVDDEGNPINKGASIYKIEMSAGGGTLPYNYIMFHAGSSFKLPVPVREGYDFAGWYIGSRKIDNTKGILNASDKLEACWIPAVYRLTYDLKGGNFTNTSKVPYLYCINKTTSLKKPVRSGYVFAGWYQKGTDIKITKLQKGWYYGGTLDLEARWYMKKGGSYSISNNNASTGGTITYDLGGGYFNNPEKVKDYYAFMTSTALPKPVKNGYRFEGWYVAGSDVRLTKICKNQYLGDVKLVAMWSRAHYTITYCANKGKGKQDKTTLIYDKTGQVRDTAFTRKGYIFTGWNTRANGTGIPYKPGDDVKNLTIKKNIKLYAQWQKLY